MTPRPPRLISIDALRGAVVALMVFVNATAEMPGVPAWTQHIARGVDEYTLTDLVFPWFLFLAGVSIPLSLERHLAPGQLRAALARILPRVAGLLLLGVAFVNLERFDAGATGLRRQLWMVLVIASAVIVFKVRAPGASARIRRGETIAKAVAAVVLAAMLLMFRGPLEDGGAMAGLRPSWWGILGMIGWGYLFASLFYLAGRGSDRVLLGLCALLMCIALGSRDERLGPLAPFEAIFRVREMLGSLTGIVVAGAVAGLWFAGDDQRLRVRRLVVFGVVLWMAGWWLRPVQGYNKIDATAAWALSAAGQAALLLVVFHLVLDRGALGPWPGRLFGWLSLVGRNALLAYVLPDFLVAGGDLVGLDFMPYHEIGGPGGLVNAGLICAAVVTLAALATRFRFTVKL